MKVGIDVHEGIYSHNTGKFYPLSELRGKYYGSWWGYILFFEHKGIRYETTTEGYSGDEKIYCTVHITEKDCWIEF
jgi:hypothetical protein